MLTKDKTSGNVPFLEITETVLMHFNIVNIDYQHVLTALYKFTPNEAFGQFNYYIFQQKSQFLKKP